MNTPTNEQRSERAYRALLVSYDFNVADADACVTDLLTDLMHLCPEYGIDFEAAVRMATMHFEAEA